MPVPDTPRRTPAPPTPGSEEGPFSFPIGITIQLQLPPTAKEVILMQV